MEKYNLDLVAKELLSYFKDKDTLENYWHEHSRREIDKFAQNNFKVSYFIFRRAILEKFNFTDRTKAEIRQLNKNHREKTCLEKYGTATPYQYGSKEFKNLMLKKFGVDNYFKTEEVKENTSKRCKGCVLTAEQKKKISNTVKSKECQEQTKKTNLEKYGVEFTFQSENNKNKAKETWKAKYGIEHAPRKLYEVNKIYFDSLPEVALYLYAKAHNEKIKRLPCKFTFEFEGKNYNYFPDFKYKDKIIEIKGSQFLAENGTWQNPYDHSLDNLMEAKRQCALENNVEIWYSNNYNKYLDWFYQQGYKKDQFLTK